MSFRDIFKKVSGTLGGYTEKKVYALECKKEKDLVTGEKSGDSVSQKFFLSSKNNKVKDVNLGYSLTLDVAKSFTTVYELTQPNLVTDTIKIDFKELVKGFSAFKVLYTGFPHGAVSLNLKKTFNEKDAMVATVEITGKYEGFVGGYKQVNELKQGFKLKDRCVGLSYAYNPYNLVVSGECTANFAKNKVGADYKYDDSTNLACQFENLMKEKAKMTFGIAHKMEDGKSIKAKVDTNCDFGFVYGFKVIPEVACKVGFNGNIFDAKKSKIGLNFSVNA